MNMPNVETDYFALKGGLDLVSPPLSIPDGFCRDSLNFDAKSKGGYERIGGYERFDGRDQPHTASYAIIKAEINGSFSDGDNITGQDSSATAVVVAVSEEYIAVTKTTGSFIVGENILVSGNVEGIAISAPQVSAADTQYLNILYKSLATNVYRADIGPVPGSGPVRGVWRYKGAVYAFRNDEASSHAVMYKSSSTGWQAVDLGYEVAFENANTDVNDGDVLTQGGVTATILKVVVEDGELLGGVNKGKLIITEPIGGSFAAAAATTSGSGSVTLSSASSAITIPPGGKYSFVNANFGGSSQSKKMYGANGVGRAFEFDGTVFIPIKSGMAVDTPKFIAEHKKFLWLTFGPSLQKGSIGDPYKWSAVVGAAEFAMGDDITGLKPLVGSENTGAMLVTTVSKTSIMYGNSSDTFQLENYSDEAGSFEYSNQIIGEAYMLDEMGIRQLSATQNFGNFSDFKSSELIEPFIKARSSSFVGSCISRLKNQYRLYYSDGYGVHLTTKNAKVVGVMPIRTAHAFNCISSNESGDGDEWIVAGGTDGYVYRLDKGTSFDGNAISAFISLSFSHQGSPRARKRYRKAVYEVTGSDYAEINGSYELGYGSVDINAGVTQIMETPFGEVYWDSFIWDNFFWDGRTMLPIEHGLDGTGENISIYLGCNNSYTSSFTINSVILHYSIRRQLR